MTRTLLYPFLLLTLLTLSSSLSPVSAQFSDIATTPQYGKDTIEDGDVLSLSEKDGKLIRSNKSYDDRMFGIAVANPIIVYKTQESTPSARTGSTYVNATTLNGPIKKGDYLTSSPIPGKAQKAGEIQGYVLGIALENLDEKSGKDIEFEGKKYKRGKILTTIGIGPASSLKIRPGGGLFGLVKYQFQSFLLNLKLAEGLDAWIRYAMAGIIALSSIVVSFRTFGRNVGKGIEAIGRNPMAKVQIQTVIIINLALIVLVCVLGILLSLAILSL